MTRPEKEKTALIGGGQRAAVEKITSITSTKKDYKTQAELSTLPQALVVLCSTNKKLCKTFFQNTSGDLREESYPQQKWFSASVHECRDINELAIFLSNIERARRLCIVRGGLVAGIDLRRMLRRSQPRNGQPAAFHDVSRLWVMIDIDKIACAALTDPAVNPVDAVLYAISLLPVEFQDISCYWQFSASQSVKNDGTLSLHLWFYLNRPYFNAELRRYAKHVNAKFGSKLIDPALFNAVQVHYTAPPIFQGIRDPLPQRSGFWRGIEDVLTLNIPIEDEIKPAYAQASGYRPGLGYENYLSCIGDDKDGFHRPILSALASAVATGIDVEIAKTDVRRAVDSASHGNRTIYAIDRYKSDAYLDDIINWLHAREHEKPHVPDSIKSLPPYFSAPTMGLVEARQELEAVITSFFASTV